MPAGYVVIWLFGYETPLILHFYYLVGVLGKKTPRHQAGSQVIGGHAVLNRKYYLSDLQRLLMQRSSKSPIVFNIGESRPEGKKRPGEQMPSVKYTRIEITQEAYMALEAEAILQGMTLKKLASEMILKGASKKALNFVQESTISMKLT